MVGIKRIQDLKEAMLNQQSFNPALDVACVRYVCDEVYRILNLSKDEVYTPSSGLIQHLLRWTVMSLTDRCATLQWQIDMMGMVRERPRAVDT